jgi:hypothetical protein
VIGEVRQAVPDTAFGVDALQDFPLDGFGLPGDLPFSLKQRVTTDLQSAQNGVNALLLGQGLDAPEAQLAALHVIATGEGLAWPGGAIAPFVPAANVVVGIADGTIGGVGFRAGALPIIVTATDAPFHTPADYAAQGITIPARNTINGELAGIGARAIGIWSSGGFGDKRDLVELAIATGAVVPPSAFGGACGAGQCCTGINNAAEPPLGGGCPLVFNIVGTGAGLGSQIVTAIKTLAAFVPIDVSAVGVNDPKNKNALGAPIDAAADFIRAIAVSASPGPGCATGLMVANRANPGDGINDTYLGVTPGTRVCFDVLPRVNTTVPGTLQPQLYRAEIHVLGSGVTELSSRQIFFLVPPDFNQPPVM